MVEDGEENYVVSFEGEIEVGAETKELAENQAYDQLSHLRQITVVAFKKEEEWVRQEIIFKVENRTSWIRTTALLALPLRSIL